MCVGARRAGSTCLTGVEQHILHVKKRLYPSKPPSYPYHSLFWWNKDGTEHCYGIIRFQSIGTYTHTQTHTQSEGRRKEKHAVKKLNGQETGICMLTCAHRTKANTHTHLHIHTKYLQTHTPRLSFCENNCKINKLKSILPCPCASLFKPEKHN